MLKILIASVFAMFATISYAKTVTKVIELPAFLVDGVVTVTLKNGTVHTFKSNDFAVVPRISTQEIDDAAIMKEAMIKARAQMPKNRLKLLVGAGTVGSTTSANSEYVTIKPKTGLVLGLSYDRLVTDTISLGAAAFTNGTVAVSVGKDF